MRDEVKKALASFQAWLCEEVAPALLEFSPSALPLLGADVFSKDGVHEVRVALREVIHELVNSKKLFYLPLWKVGDFWFASLSWYDGLLDGKLSALSELAGEGSGFTKEPWHRERMRFCLQIMVEEPSQVVSMTPWLGLWLRDYLIPRVELGGFVVPAFVDDLGKRDLSKIAEQSRVLMLLLKMHFPVYLSKRFDYLDRVMVGEEWMAEEWRERYLEETLEGLDRFLRLRGVTLPG